MIVISTIIDKLSSRRDKTWSIVLGTQELTPEQSAEIVKLNGAMCFVAFKMDAFQSDETKIIEALQTDPDLNVRSLSERQRNCFYVLWKQKPEGFKEFKDFYEYKMTAIIDHIKSKLEP